MAEYKRGIEAGILAGLIEGIIAGILFYALYQFLFTDMIAAAQADAVSHGYSGPALQAYMSTWVGNASLIMLVIQFIGAVVWGVIIGSIYANAYKPVAGGSIVKGIILGFIFWILVLIPSFSYVTAILYDIISMLLGVFLFGVLIGFFWDKLGGKK
ncbi:MAG: hypothetical protein WED05_07590 [Candidatus Atabeyarchaeum deiterrae]